MTTPPPPEPKPIASDDAAKRLWTRLFFEMDCGNDDEDDARYLGGTFPLKRALALKALVDEETAELRQRAATLEKGIRAVEALIDESGGVDGLHLNGDLAPWNELRTGGRYEEWLLDFDVAAAPLTPAARRALTGEKE